MPPAEFYERLLAATLSAIGAPAGVIWLLTPQSCLQITCEKNRDKVGLDARRGSRQCHNEILRQVFQAQPLKPRMVEPQGGRLSELTDEMGVPAANFTDYYTLLAPIIDPQKDPLGILEVFFPAHHDPRTYRALLDYVARMAAYASRRQG